MSEDGSEPTFGRLTTFPPNAAPPLPPPKPWLCRLPGLIWRLFPATLVCSLLFGLFGFLILGAVEMLLSVLGGLAVGALVGLYIDFKHSLGGATIDGEE